MKKTSGQRTRNTRYNANSEIHESIIPQLLEKIGNLRDSPKVIYLKEQILSKFVSDETDPALTRRTRAINKWLATESSNLATSERLLVTPSDYEILPGVGFDRFVEFARRIIVDILGDTVPIDALIGSFSGGASTGRLRTESYPASKYLGLADTTPACRALFDLIYESEMPGWSSFSDLLSIREVPGNVLFTVPKNTTIDRCACKEPEINMFIQKGIGQYIRTALRRVRIDLNDQSINRRLARIGSIDGSLATLDLSSASDSISHYFVQLMLPELWFDVLNQARSPITIIDGEEHVNEMFSSMGNGFTFELESLLFYALARATAYFRGVRGVISVYGDDIIVPNRLADDLTGVLDYFGFEVNTSKSYSSGPFRESCGGHYYDGDDITPFYIRGPIKRMIDLIHLANSLRKWSRLSMAGGILDPEVEPIWVWLRDKIPGYLWGGHDCSDKTSLVTNHPPRKRLVAISTRKQLDTGGYIHWLNTTQARGTCREEAVITSSLSKASTRYRLRPALQQSCVTKLDYFYHEIGRDEVESRYP